MKKSILYSLVIFLSVFLVDSNPFQFTSFINNKSQIECTLHIIFRYAIMLSHIL